MGGGDGGNGGGLAIGLSLRQLGRGGGDGGGDGRRLTRSTHSGVCDRVAVESDLRVGDKTGVGGSVGDPIGDSGLGGGRGFRVARLT